jgi:hypothetical protein
MFSFTMESICIGFTIPKKKLLLTGIFFLLFDGNLSQGESNAKKLIRSTLINSEFNRKLSIIDGQRIKDSIKR